MLTTEQLLRVRRKPNPAIIALEKEVERFRHSIKKNSERNTLGDFTASKSFTLLELWNKYFNSVPAEVFNKQIINMGGLLFEKQEYAVAKNLCYQWYLDHCVPLNHEGCDIKEKYFSNGFKGNSTVLTLKALIGTAVCSFYLVQQEDTKLMDPSHRSSVVRVLSQLRDITQAGLYHEPLYWLVHNGVVHMYTIAQYLMTLSFSHLAVEYLLWTAVCLESSVPLMAVKFLPLRASVYTAVCQCYYDINEPSQAELFARRGLGKVNELAHMENISAEETTETSEVAFRAATLKLGVMVFKRSVLESRTKNKSILRTKSKPTIKDSIQGSPWPRSPTEKLISEIFTGRAAQFLAVLKTLEDHRRRPLQQGPPNPKTELDQDTITDVYYELFCAGTELALAALEASVKDQLEPGGEGQLLQLAITGQDVLCVGAVEMFARLAYNYDQMEVFNMLLDPLDHYLQENITYCRTSLTILSEVESLRQQVKATHGKDSSSKPQIIQLLPLARLLEQAIEKVDDYDLLLDASLLLWKHSSQYYQHIVSCDLSTLRHHEMDQSHTLTPPLNFVQLLVTIQSIFHHLNVWRIDVVLYCSVCLKLGLLYEGGAQKLQVDDASTGRYDRAKLLDSKVMVEAGLAAVSWARSGISYTKDTAELGVVHCELLYTRYRLQVKLASTLLPALPPPPTAKPSMLKSKVKERQMVEENRRKAMASLTAPDTLVSSWDELVYQCGSDHCCYVLLLMAQSCINTEKTGAIEKLVKEAETNLVAYDEKQKRPQQSRVARSPPHSVPPAPELVKYSGTHMVFKPSQFIPESGAEVCWYKLFGCRAAGSNVKVRLSDHDYPGLGQLAPTTEPLMVTGLQPNETYVFAVAAYTAAGKLVGGSIGDTSRPLVASYDMPVLVLWGYLAQCAYASKVHSVALRAVQALRSHFIADGQLRMDLMQSYPTAIARLFLNSVFIHVSVSIEEGGLWCDQVAVPPSLMLTSQQARLQLCTQLLTALEVGQFLNSPSYCLQAVVMSYGLLSPLLQYGLTTKSVAWMLMHCFSILQEVPIPLLLHSQSHLHHMVAVISYNLAQLMLQWKEKSMLNNVCEATKLLLLATLPVTSSTHSSGAEQGSIPSVSHPLYQQIKGSTVLSEANNTGTQGSLGGAGHHSLLTTLTTISSIMTSSVPTKKGGTRQKRGRRNNTLGQDTITEEMKSAEIKAMEAFVLSTQGSNQLDDTELTGQEDINLLHTIINTLPLTAAYKEVVKFHRRPHYLSLFVLLLQQAIAETRYDLVLEWSREARHWLCRRNELLLTHNLHQQRPGSAAHNKASRKSMAPKKVPKPDTHPQPNKVQIAQSRALVRATSRHVQQQQLRRGMMHVAKIEITRDDLTLKARAVLRDKLSTMWKQSCRRRKLREVLSDEMCWRAQFNLCQAVSSFQLLLGKVEKPQSDLLVHDHSISHSMLRLDMAMIIISGVIPAPGWRTMHSTEEPKEVDAEEPVEPSVRPESARIEMKDTDSNLAVALGSSAALLYNRPPIPCSSKSDTPPLKEKTKTSSIQSEVQECFTYYQRAIVLAYRRKTWTLLQNSCRALWNAITAISDSLRYYGEEENAPLPLSTVYAVSVSSLYFALDSLLDMSDELPMKLPEGHMATSPLYYTTSSDDTSSMDGNFIVRLGLLALHVFYVNRHWEKLLHCGTRLLHGAGQYKEQILPILLYAQQRLKDRIVHYGPLIKDRGLHPAAHLDPGPRGHDIYGSIGYSLILTRLTIDPDQLLKEPYSQCVIPDYQRSVCYCRSLLARYLASSLPLLVGQRTSNIVSSVPPPVQSTNSVVEAPPISADQVHTIVEAFSNAISCLEQQDQLSGLRCELMSEIGALLMHNGDMKLAGKWWDKALEELVSVAGHMTLSAVTVMESSGLWGCILAGILAARLAQYLYYNELDHHNLYIQMSAELFKVLLKGNISIPNKDIDYAIYTIEGVNLLPGLDVFSKPFHCNAHSIADALQYVCEQLVHSNQQYTESLPLITIYEYVSQCVLCNIHHYVMSLLLKVESLTQLSMFSEALQLLWQVLTGDHLPVAGLPSVSSTSAIHRSQMKFDNAKPLTDQRNFKVLATVLDRSLSPSLQKLYGEGLMQRVMLTQAGLLNILGRAGHCSRPATTLSDYVPSTSGHLTSEAPSSAETNSSNATNRSKGKPPPSQEEIKLLLLDHSEHLICQLCGKLSAKLEAGLSCLQMWMLIKSDLLLAKVARLYHQPTTAVKICHNAMISLQQHLHQTNNPRWGASPVIGAQMWLECQLELLGSLAHCHNTPKGWGDCIDVLEEGLKGTTACGDELIADKMKLQGVLYFLKTGEKNIAKRYLPQSLSPTQGSCDLTDIQTQLLWCDEASPDPVNDYTTLEQLIVKILAERTPLISGQKHNVYQHDLRLFLAQVGSQLSYLQLRQITGNPNKAMAAEDTCKSIITRLDTVVEACHLYGDQCITVKATALFSLATAWKVVLGDCEPTMESLQEVASKYVESLLTIHPASLAHVGLVVNCYLELAKLFIARTVRSGTRVSPPQTGTPPPSRRGRSPDKDSKESYKDKMVAWSCVKAAAAIKQSYMYLSTMTAGLHKEDIMKNLTDKALVDLPDFVLAELSTSPSNTTKSVTIDSLAPSKQSFSLIGLTWLPVLNYHYSLHQQLTPPYGLLPTGLPVEVISVASKCSHLHRFLSNHYPHYSKTCTIPAIPKVLLPYAISQQSAPAMTGTYTPIGDWEVVVLWHTPVFNPSDVLHGTVALHHKSANQQQASIKVFTLQMTSQQLESVLSEWLQLSSQCEQAVTDSKQTTTMGDKTSSKSKRKLKQTNSGIEIEDSLSRQVQSLLATLTGKKVTDIIGRIPVLSASSVSAVTKLLQPLGQCIANGEDIYKLFHKVAELLIY